MYVETHNSMAYLCAAVVGVIFLATSPRAGAPPAAFELGESNSAGKARLLWEQAIAAKGGRARLHQVTSFLNIWGNPQRYDWKRRKGGLGETLYVLPDRYWSWSDHPARIFSPISPSVEVYDGSRTVYMSQFGTSRKPTVEEGRVHFGAEAREDFLAWGPLSFLLETRWLKPVPVSSGKAVLNDKWVDVVETVVETEPGIYKATYFLDTKSHLPLEVDIVRHNRDGSAHHVCTIWMGDYSTVDGLAMPRKLNNFDGRRLWGPITFRFNVDYDERIFQNLPWVENGPEAWAGGPP